MYAIDTVSSARCEINSPNAGIRFELHAAALEPDEILDPAHLPWRPAVRRRSAPAFSIREDEGLVWVKVADRNASAPLETLSARTPGALGFQVVRRQFSAYLAMRSLRADVLVNSLPALRFSTLASQDSIVLAGPQRMFYVTERFSPWVGPPPEKSVGRDRCAHCRNVLAEDTRVISCYCGALLHWETAESHPHIDEEDRLDCAARRKICPCCGRELTTYEVLIWDPLTI